MANILLGLVGLYALIGGGKKTINNMGLKNIEVAVIALMTILLNLPNSFNISDGIYFKLGGVLLYIAALSIIFFERNGLVAFYCIFMSAALGLLYFELGELMSTGAISLFDNPKIAYLVIVVLITVLLSNSPRTALIISVFSMVLADVIYFIVYKSEQFSLGYGNQFDVVVIVSVASIILHSVFKRVFDKLFPSAAFMMNNEGKF